MTDWVITTSFYSALHFVSYKIFPFQVPAPGGKKTAINNVDELSNYNNTKGLSRHQMLQDICYKKCPEIADAYSRLKDMSMTARYSTFRHSKEVANSARVLLKKIKEHCSK